MDVKEERVFGASLKAHWYYIAKGSALQEYVRHLHVLELLDIGAGSGIFSRQLLNAGISDSACCVDPNYETERYESENGKPIRFVRSVAEVPQRLILMMDVLEHVDDDVALLRSYVERMPPEAQVLITVPAFAFLWSEHDVFLEHRRRYTTKMLTRTVQASGLEIVSMHYFFGFLFPIAALVRLLRNLCFKAGVLEAKSQLKSTSAWLNNLLIAIHRVERSFLFRHNRLAGLTLFCLCRKPAS